MSCKSITLKTDKEMEDRLWVWKMAGTSSESSPVVDFSHNAFEHLSYTTVMLD